MDMNVSALIITAAATLFMAIATIVIAYYSWQSHKLTIELQKRDEEREQRHIEHDQQTRDLYQAIALSTILTAPRAQGTPETHIQKFKELYTGKTPIFEKK